MVFGELAPKNLSIARPEPIAKALASSIGLFLRVFGPVIRLFDGAANRLLRAVGIEPVEELATGVSTDELDFIVEESAREGALTERQAALLSSALDFQDLIASEVMVPRVRVATVPVTATGADLRALLATPFTKYPVVEEAGDLDEVVGVAHVEDLLQFPAGERDAVPVTAIMRPPLLVPESAEVSVVLDRLRTSEARMAVVIDEYGGAAGILTMEDLVEELVGDITDEHDVEEMVVRPVGEGTWLVPGGWRIDEVERDTGVVLPEGEYDTLGGLMMHELGRVPVVGDEVALPGAALHVAEMRRRQVVGVVLRAVPGEPR
jgi:CBS domain containing-hemolysin-like protein